MNSFVTVAFVVGVLTTLLVFIVAWWMFRKHSVEQEPLPTQSRQGETLSLAGGGEVTTTASEIDVAAPEPAKYLTIKHSDSSVPDLFFERDDSFHLQKHATGITGSGFNHMVPALVTNSLIAVGVKGTFRATADPMTLVRYADGSYSAMVKGAGGKIAKHQGFVPTDAAKVFAPIVVFQVLSIVTGQYYLHGIAKQLNDISAKLDKLIMYHHNERTAKLKTYCQTLQDLLSKDSAMVEDATIVQMMLLDIDSIEREYTNNLLGIDENRYANSTNEGWGSSTPQLDMLEGYLSSDTPVTYAEMILLARRARTLARMTELKVNMLLSRQDSGRIERSRALLERMITAAPSNSKDDGALCKVKRVLGEASRVAKEIEKQAARDSSKRRAKSISRSISKQMKDIDESYDEARNSMLSLVRNLEQRMQKKQDVVLVSNSEGIRLLCPSHGATSDVEVAAV